MFSITYNGKNSNDIGVYVIKRPNIPSPELRYEETTIAGRDGTLITTDETYNNIEIPIPLNYMTKKTEWASMHRLVKAWLLSRNGDRFLEFSDDGSFFYKVKNVTIGINERTSMRIGVITPVFLCDPFQYLKTGLNKYDISEVLINPYFKSKPVYYITGNGTCTLNINGNTIVAEVEDNLVIDCELLMAYKEDGVLKNTAITGDYEQMNLLEGKNEISISEGFHCKIRPNWRCL